MAGALQHRGAGRWAAPACLLTGCFYVDPINQRPAGSLSCGVPDPDSGICEPWPTTRECTAGLHRGHAGAFLYQFSDPEAGDNDTAWRTYACSLDDASPRRLACDVLPFFTYDMRSAAPEISRMITVPAFRSDADVPVTAIRADIVARDDRGAATTTRAEYCVDNAPPSASLQVVQRREHPVGLAVDLIGQYADPDDLAASVASTWTLTPPAGVALPELLDISSQDDNLHQRTVRKRFVPLDPGTWTAQISAVDPAGRASIDGAAPQKIEIEVAPDRPPCLALWQPRVPPDDARLPISAPTVFQIAAVDDDLDRYPLDTSDPVFGTPAFAWSILRPGASAREPLVGATGNSADLDPAAFAPGSQLELRVEVVDRSHAQVTCDDAAPRCPADPAAVCVQRQTWRIEVR